MQTTPSGTVNVWLGHIRNLAEGIGPRGSTTEGERLGSAYCQEALSRLGYSPAVEAFRSARSIYQPHLLAACMLLTAFVLYPLGGRLTGVLAALISCVALISDLMELGFRDNLLRRLLPKADSQNVVAILPPRGEHRADLILIGHVDSHRTPIIFSSARWVALYKAFTTVAFVGFLVQAVLYVLGAVSRWAWIWPVSGLSAVLAVLLMAMCLQADSTPFSAGANDNASAVGLVLTLAEQLLAEALQHTRVWFACTGCEEVQHYGAIDFFRRHTAELVKPRALAFELMGCAGPAWLVKEGIIVPFYADPEMLRLAETLSAGHPEWGAHPTRINGGNTEMADALRAGVPAMTLMGMTRDGEAPYWHMLEDTVDKMDPVVMGRAYAFTWALLRALDEGERSPGTG